MLKSGDRQNPLKSYKNSILHSDGMVYKQMK